MSTAVLNPPPQASNQTGLRPHRWTIAEYRELDKTRLFHDVKTMLIDGEVYVTPMPSPPHDTALGLAEEFLRSILPAGFHLRSQMAFDIGTQNDPGPDVPVVPGSIRDYTRNAPTSAIMVIEVSFSTLFMDMTTKAELYATAGVPDYWVIDIENRQLHVFRDPVALPAGLGATAYRTRKTFGSNDTVSPLAVPSASVKVADLLP